jgi:hypothetical protein
MSADDTNIVPPQNAITPAKRPELKADHHWYSSLFTQLLAPLVATRYVWLAIEEINPFNFLGKKKPDVAIDAKPWKEPSFARYASRNFAAFGMGATFLGIMGMYSKNTLHDIKSIYAEAVGYELGKKTEDVTLADVFIKSKNEALNVTRNAYMGRTLARSATASTFFIPWHKFRDKSFQTVQPKYDVNANAGVGAIGVHIYGEGFLREPSFFDIQQKLISSKINRNDVNPYSPVQPQDIQTLLTLQRKHLDKNYRAPLGASQEAQNDARLSTRIAELLNSTYDHIPQVDEKSFTLGKFNYLIGFGLLDKFPESLAYVELANNSPDMEAVKRVAGAIKNGQDQKTAFAQAGIDIGKLVAEPARQAETPSAGEEKFTKNIKAKTFTDFAAQSPDTNLKI